MTRIRFDNFAFRLVLCSGELNQQKNSDHPKYSQDVDVLKSYKSRIQELEADLIRSKRLNSSKRSEIDYLDLDDNALHPKSCLFPVSDSKTAEVVGKLLSL